MTTETNQTLDHVPAAFTDPQAVTQHVPATLPGDTDELFPSTPPNPPLEADTVRQVNTAWLKPHPFNAEVYGGSTADDDLVESIRNIGIRTPLLVTADGVVVSGHRRLAAAYQACLATVPVLVVRPRSYPGSVEGLILEANLTRVKNDEQRIREFIAYKCIETARAEDRNGYRRDLVSNSPPGDAEPKPGVIPHLISTVIREAGKARDLAARKVGMSGSTATQGEKVVTALDRLLEEDNWKALFELRRALVHQSIHAAFKLGLEHGWIPKPVSKKQKQGIASVKNPGQQPDDEVHQDPEDNEAVDDPSTDTGHIINVTGANATPSPESTPTLQTRADIYRDRPLPSHEDAEPPQAAPAPFNAGRPSPRSSTVHSSAVPDPTAPGPVAAFNDSDPDSDRLIPAEVVARVAAAVSRRDFPGCDEPAPVECSRRFGARIARLLDEQAKEFPDMAGRDLCRALGTANTKLQIAMKWL